MVEISLSRWTRSRRECYAVAMYTTAPATITVDRYVLQTLMPDLVGHDRKPSAFLVYLFLWAATSAGEASAEASLGRIAEGTGLSKRAVQHAVALLVRRELLAVDRMSITAVARYTIQRPWRRGGSDGAPGGRGAP